MSTNNNRVEQQARVNGILDTPWAEITALHRKRPPVSPEEQATVSQLAIEVFRNPDTTPIPERQEILENLAFEIGESDKINVETIPNMIRYVERLHDAGHSEIATLVLVVSHHGDRKEIIARHDAYVALMLGDLGSLIAGEG